MEGKKTVVKKAPAVIKEIPSQLESNKLQLKNIDFPKDLDGKGRSEIRQIIEDLEELHKYNQDSF